MQMGSRWIMAHGTSMDFETIVWERVLRLTVTRATNRVDVKQIYSDSKMIIPLCDMTLLADVLNSIPLKIKVLRSFETSETHFPSGVK